MNESRELAAARAAMAAAEAAWASAEGLARLGDGLGRLADIMDVGTAAESRIASNVAASYAGRFYARVRDKLDRDAQIPEPELEHCFKVVLAFDQVESALPAAAADLKIGVVAALIERYYEGHPPEKKRAALEQLAALRRSR
jgi:hypothetical protein